MNKKKLITFILGIFFMVFLFGNVSAVVVYSDWETGSQQEEIDYNQEIDFNVDIGTMNPSMKINVKLYDSEYNLVYSYENDLNINDYSYHKIYTLDKSIYKNPGNYKLIVSAEDSEGSSQSETLSIKINELQENNPPEITSSPIKEVDEDSYYEYQVKATDEDGDDLTYSLLPSHHYPEWLSISSNGKVYGNSPSVDSDKDYGIEVKVSDGQNYDIQSYILTVKDVFENTAPEVTINSPEQGETFENKEITAEFNIYDSENNLNTCEYEINGNTNSLSCSEGTNTFYVPSNELNEGTNTLTVYAQDSEGASDSDSVSFTIELEEPNNPPEINNIPDQTIVLGEESFESFDLDNYASDEDDPQEELTYSYSGNQKIIVEIDNNNVVSLRHPKSWTGKEYIKFTVTDPHGASDSTTASFEVTEPENNPPKIISSPITEVNESSYYEYEVIAEDQENDDLTYSLTQSPEWLSISSNGKIYGNSPSVDSDNDYQVKIKVSDGQDYDTQPYTLTVKNISEPDTTPPEITVFLPEQGEKYPEKSNLVFLASLNEPGELNYSLDNNENITMDYDGTYFNSQEINLNVGEHKVIFYAEDEAGNTAKKIIDFYIKEDNGDDNSGDDDKDKICYKIINGNCLSYYEYLYYKQNTPGEHPTYINNTQEKISEDSKVNINLFKWVFWTLLIGSIVLFAIIIRYSLKALYIKNKH